MNSNFSSGGNGSCNTERRPGWGGWMQIPSYR
uniref:Uncharacterized protein n=1 Tax=Rhizophora mucronata TaxID=61149 RepID=A0A2P2QE90_RHIMU